MTPIDWDELDKKPKPKIPELRMERSSGVDFSSGLEDLIGFAFRSLTGRLKRPYDRRRVRFFHTPGVSSAKYLLELRHGETHNHMKRD